MNPFHAGRRAAKLGPMGRRDVLEVMDRQGNDTTTFCSNGEWCDWLELGLDFGIRPH